MPVSAMSRRPPKKRSPYKTNAAELVSMAVATQAASQIKVTCVFKDANGNQVAEKVGFRAYMSSDTAGLALAIIGAAVTMDTNSGLMVLDSAETSFFVVTNASGIAVFKFPNNTTGTYYLNIVMPDGSVVTSGAITLV